MKKSFQDQLTYQFLNVRLCADRERDPAQADAEENHWLASAESEAVTDDDIDRAEELAHKGWTVEEIDDALIVRLAKEIAATRGARRAGLPASWCVTII